VAYADNRDRADLDDELLRLALTKLVEIVGEAAKQVNPAQLYSATSALPIEPS
jgi:hypothetical protein